MNDEKESKTSKPDAVKVLQSLITEAHIMRAEPHASLTLKDLEEVAGKRDARIARMLAVRDAQAIAVGQRPSCGEFADEPIVASDCLHDDLLRRDAVYIAITRTRYAYVSTLNGRRTTSVPLSDISRAYVNSLGRECELTLLVNDRIVKSHFFEHHGLANVYAKILSACAEQNPN